MFARSSAPGKPNEAKTSRVCGFPRQPDEGPILYPAACSPQAWAAGSVFLLLQACLGLEINGIESQICLSRPQSPPYVEKLRIHNLRVGKAMVDLLVERHERDVSVDVLHREGDVQVLVVK